MKLKNIQKTIVALGMVALFAVTFTVATPRAHAQNASIEALQNQIQQLLQLVRSLQERLHQLTAGDDVASPIELPTVAKPVTFDVINIGSRVESIAYLKARNDAGLQMALNRVVRPGTLGQVIDGPRQSDGYTWWRVRYDDGTTGWSVVDWLRQYVTTDTTDCPDCDDPYPPEEGDTYGISDIASVTSRYVDPNPNMADEEYTLYSIILKNGTKFEVIASGFAPATAFEKSLRATGYTGTIAAFNALVETIIIPDCPDCVDPYPVEGGDSYSLSDVQSVSMTTTDPIPNAVDDEYTTYTVLLKDNSIRTFDVYSMEESVTIAARVAATGYTGPVDALLQLAQ